MPNNFRKYLNIKQERTRYLKAKENDDRAKRKKSLRMAIDNREQ